jgi:septum formation protein
LASTLWVAPEKLVLASQSKARLAMLASAGVEIEVVPAEIDERAIEAERGAGLEPADVALMLAQAKALAVSAKLPDRLVLGSDQTLEMGGALCAKVSDRAAASARLRLMSGRAHALHSAYCFVRGGLVLHSGAGRAELWAREMSEAFIDAYLDASLPGVLGSVAVYEIEGLGVQMFERVKGDWFTILGLPLMDVIAFLRQQGWLLR